MEMGGGFVWVVSGGEVVAGLVGRGGRGGGVWIWRVLDYGTSEAEACPMGRSQSKGFRGAIPGTPAGFRVQGVCMIRYTAGVSRLAEYALVLVVADAMGGSRTTLG